MADENKAVARKKDGIYVKFPAKYDAVRQQIAKDADKHDHDLGDYIASYLGKNYKSPA